MYQKMCCVLEAKDACLCLKPKLFSKNVVKFLAPTGAQEVLMFVRPFVCSFVRFKLV